MLIDGIVVCRNAKIANPCVLYEGQIDAGRVTDDDDK